MFEFSSISLIIHYFSRFFSYFSHLPKNILSHTLANTFLCYRGKLTAILSFKISDKNRIWIIMKEKTCLKNTIRNQKSPVPIFSNFSTSWLVIITSISSPIFNVLNVWFTLLGTRFIWNKTCAIIRAWKTDRPSNRPTDRLASNKISLSQKEVYNYNERSKHWALTK